jgi:hypothetical protein
MDVLHVPIYRWLLVPFDESPLSDTFIDRVIDSVVAPLVRRGPGSPASGKGCKARASDSGSPGDHQDIGECIRALPIHFTTRPDSCGAE